MRRKDRDRLLDDFVTGVFGIAVVAGVVAGIASKSVVRGVVVFLVVVGALVAVVWLWKTWRRARLLRDAGMDVIDQMSGEAFEGLLLAHFAKQGYSARLTPNGADFGADLVLARAGETCVVQAKRWKSPVGVRAVQEVAAAKAHYRADSAVVLTNSTFTEQAVQLAGSNGVELWDRSRLKQELGSIEGPEFTEPQRAPERTLLEDAEPQPVLCPRCGSPMVRRTGKHGLFWGCPGYPRCRGTRAL